ncbi:MAG: helix-turn-helix transcriptional regulator [Pseudomonadota bacterium]|nr:helix-turn-helix transcriptional regulator [Pseudomonadota bacterium]
MADPIQFKSGEFYGDAHHGAGGSVFDIQRLTATRSEDEVCTHRHDDAHFVLVLSGVYVSSALHAPVRAASPTLVFNPAGTTHRDRFVDGRGSFLTLSLDPAVLEGAQALRDAPQQAIVLAAPVGVAAAFRVAREIGRGGDVALLEAGAWEVLASLQGNAASAPRTLPPWAHQAYDAVMDMAADSHLRIADLAAALGVHPVHLARVFRQAWGCSPGELLRWRRVDQASGLLRRRGLAMAEVAATVGFADQSHMNRAFQAQYGMTPASYRQRMFQTSKTTPRPAG